jgi:hypothetical protein
MISRQGSAPRATQARDAAVFNSQPQQNKEKEGLIIELVIYEHRRAERGARPIYLTRSELTFRGGGGRQEVIGQVKSQ